jgi:uncharacterized membrane protein
MNPSSNYNPFPTAMASRNVLDYRHCTPAALLLILSKQMEAIKSSPTKKSEVLSPGVDHDRMIPQFSCVKEAHRRSLAKAVSWRLTGSIDTFVLSFLITGSVRVAGSISGVELFTKILLFYFHERIWTLVPWGRR